jgi:hypothetical protein
MNTQSELKDGEHCIIVRIQTNTHRDLSVFTISEWKNIIMASLYLAEAIRWCVNMSDSEYEKSGTFRSAAYYFNNSGFCNNNTPINLDYKTIIYNSEHYSDILYEYVDNRYRTFNNFRNWINDNTEKLENSLDILKQHGVSISQNNIDSEWNKFDY